MGLVLFGVVSLACASPSRQAGQSPALDGDWATLGQPIPAPDPWNFPAAADRVRRLTPDGFTSAPEAVRSWLAGLGCRVPQAAHGFVPEPNNLVAGELARRGQRDWAAFCSKDGRSRVVIYWGGPARCPAPGGAADDAEWVSADHGAVLFHRALFVTPRGRLLEHEEFPVDSEPPDGRHDGLEVAILEKASTIYYCLRGRWIELMGAD